MLAVVGGVIGGIWWAASAVQKNIKIQSVAEDIILFCDKARKVMPRQAIPDLTDFLTSSQIIAMELLPKTWIRGANTVAPFGINLKIGNMNPSQVGYVGQSSGMGVPFQGTMFLAFGATKEPCVKLVTYIGKRMVSTPVGSRSILMIMVQKWSDNNFTALLNRKDYLDTVGWLGSDDFSDVDSTCGNVNSLNFYCPAGY